MCVSSVRVSVDGQRKTASRSGTVKARHGFRDHRCTYQIEREDEHAAARVDHVDGLGEGHEDADQASADEAEQRDRQPRPEAREVEFGLEREDGEADDDELGAL